MPKGKEPVQPEKHERHLTRRYAQLRAKRHELPPGAAGRARVAAGHERAKKRPHKKYSLTDMNAQEGR